ncbi:RHS repeat domain-containing protein [Streptomyces umbrinus]|uniref:RHS repeat domain-containing protein n=1 Tax=Streptomyces umbrinus TaxID=67370 RepID=UPI00167E9CC5
MLDQPTAPKVTDAAGNAGTYAYDARGRVSAWRLTIASIISTIALSMRGRMAEGI